jgi:hypothetical protein
MSQTIGYMEAGYYFHAFSRRRKYLISPCYKEIIGQWIKTYFIPQYILIYTPPWCLPLEIRRNEFFEIR